MVFRCGLGSCSVRLSWTRVAFKTYVRYRASTGRTAWRRGRCGDDAVEAVTAELRAAERKRPTELGWAQRQQEGATPLHARFEVDVREQGGLDLDAFDELKLRATDGTTFPVLEVLVQEPDRLVVLASARATGELVLLASRDPRFILERLCERWRS
jgi:hypothetical protein